MKGDLCQFDHGNDPVVIDDVSLPNVLQLNQNGPPPPPSGPPSLPVIHQRPPGPGQPMLGPRGPPISGQRPPMPPLGPMGPRPMIGGPPPPPLPPGQRPILRPGEEAHLLSCKSVLLKFSQISLKQVIFLHLAIK